MAHTATTILQAIADVLQCSTSDLDSLWTDRATRALQDANDVIEEVLIAKRGYTAAQVAAWDSLDRYVRRLSLFFCFSEAPEQQGVTWDQIRSWDERKKLEEVAVLDGSTSLPVETEAFVSGGDLNDGPFIPNALDDAEYVED